MRVFVSYAPRDEAFVRTLVRVLRAAGHAPLLERGARFTDPEIARQIAVQLARCVAVISVVSPQSVESEACRWMLAEAMRQGKPVILALVDRAGLPDGWNTGLRGAPCVEFSGEITPESAAQFAEELTRLTATPVARLRIGLRRGMRRLYVGVYCAVVAGLAAVVMVLLVAGIAWWGAADEPDRDATGTQAEETALAAVVPATQTPDGSPEATLVVGPTLTPKSAALIVMTATPSITRPPTETFTPTRTDSPTPTPTLTYTRTATPTRRPTVTHTATPSATPTLTPTPTRTPTGTATFTPTATETPTITLTPLPRVTGTNPDAIMESLVEAGVIADYGGYLAHVEPEVVIDLSLEDDTNRWVEFAGKGVLTDFVLGAAVEWGPGAAEDSCGFIFRKGGDERFYMLDMDRDGRTFFSTKQDGEWKVVEGPTTAAGARRDMLLAGIGSRFVLFVDGVYVTAFEDAGFAFGSVAVTMNTFDESGSTWCRFSDVWVWDMTGDPSEGVLMQVR